MESTSEMTDAQLARALNAPGVIDHDTIAARAFLNTPEAKVLRALYLSGALTPYQYRAAFAELKAMK